MKILLSTFLILLSVNLLSVTNAIAQSSSRASIEAYLIATDARRASEVAISQIKDGITDLLNQTASESDGTEQMVDLIDALFDLVQSELNWELIKEKTIESYQAHFTEQEIQDMLEFSRTDSGQAMVDKSSLINQDVLVQTMQIMQTFYQRIEQNKQEMQDEITQGRQGD